MGTNEIIYGLAIVCAVGLISMNTYQASRRAVGRYLRSLGNQVLSIQGDSFTVGGLGFGHGVRFVVRYLDPEGSEHEVRTQWTFWGGVWTRDDRIVKPAEPEKK